MLKKGGNTATNIAETAGTHTTSFAQNVKGGGEYLVDGVKDGGNTVVNKGTAFGGHVKDGGNTMIDHG